MAGSSPAESHLVDAAIEDAEWLLESGCSWDEITRRTGILRGTYEKNYRTGEASA